MVGDVYAQDGKKMSKAEQAKAEADMDTAVIQAANHAKKQGKLPANMDRYVQGLTEYSVDWKELLRQFLERTMSKSDYDWRMPNKRYACQQGVYLPALWGEQEELEDACIFVDTSGSMSQKELEIISGHLGHMLEMFNLKLHIVYCDTAVAHTEVKSRDDLLEDGLQLEAKGGGGTSFIPPFEHIEEEGIRPKFVIYFTDLCCNSFPEEPNFPVFWGYLKGSWGHYSEDNVPFGEVVEIDINGEGDE
jgi:predicted metal-dependent peptidase